MSIDFSAFPLPFLVAIFITSACVILFAGVRIAKVAERIAERTGLGQAIVGAVFLGISTSLSGAILSCYAAANNHPDLAISNAVGGIAAQTFFLALADISYRKANLEHAASSLENLMQSGLLIALLSIPMIAANTFDANIWGVHPASFLMIIIFIGGMIWVKHAKDKPLWSAKETEDTQKEGSAVNVKDSKKHSLKRLLPEFGALSVLTCAIGIILAKSAIALTMLTGLNETVIGSFLTSVITSLPELVTALAAIRSGALNLAMGDIIGGNAFDVLFLSGSDIFYRAGSIYHAMDSSHFLILSMTILMTAVLVMGMLRRERSGLINIGAESVALIVCYAFLVIAIAFL